MVIKSLYNKKVIEHFLKPKNMGEIKNPSGVGRVGNPLCGDVMELYLKIREAKSKKPAEAKIIEAKFKTFGCGAAIASSSMLTEMIKGKTLQEVKKISNQAVSEALGGLPPIKRHCSVLAKEALAQAIVNYQKNRPS